MKSSYLIAFFGALLVSWKIKSSDRQSDHPNDAIVANNVRQRGLVQTAFDYSASPSAQATDNCVLVNAVVNETATSSDQQTWFVDTTIPSRIQRFYNNDGYDKVFVCGNGVGLSVSGTTSYRYMGCTVGDSTGVLANPAVVNWSSTVADNTTITDSLGTRIHDALGASMTSLPSSIEGIDLLDTCQQFDKKLVFVTDEFEELIEGALTVTDIKTDIQNNGYILDAISHWSTGSYVGTYISSVS
mmetsp:Transcript_8434/g.20288  ORF Transcript_8434/g.20288 Transcript_8434/m.20288 type:complete len:243 (+) Transcript_8434:146-874(+)